MLKPTVYLLCAMTSIACMILLIRGWTATRTRLLLWSAMCFVALAINNLLLFVDLILLPDIDLLPLRGASLLIAVSVLIYGLVWEVE